MLYTTDSECQELCRITNLYGIQRVRYFSFSFLQGQGKNGMFVSSLLVKCLGENERKKEKTEKEKEALKRYLLY